MGRVVILGRFTLVITGPGPCMWPCRGTRGREDFQKLLASQKPDTVCIGFLTVVGEAAVRARG
jgi:hypothetical protein